MHYDNQCKDHRKKILYICTSDTCSGLDSQLCEECFEYDKHSQCKDKDQILPFKQFINRTIQLMNQMKEEEDVYIENLEETFIKFEKFLKSAKLDFQKKKDQYFDIKQLAERLDHYRDPKYLYKMKKNPAYKQDFFQENQQEEREERNINKYISEIDNSLGKIKDIWTTNINDQEPHQQLIDQAVSGGNRSSQSNPILAQNDQYKSQQKVSTKQIKVNNKQINMIQQQQDSFRESQNYHQQRQNNNNQYDHNNNDEFRDNQFNENQNPQSRIEQNQSNNYLVQHNPPNQIDEIDKSAIKQQVNQMDFPHPLPTPPQGSQSLIIQPQSNKEEYQVDNSTKSMIAPQNQIQDESNIKRQNTIRYKKQFSLQPGNNPIIQIEVVDSKKLIYLDNQNQIFTINNYSLYNKDNKSKSHYQTKMSIEIYEFKIVKKQQILIHTTQGLHLLNEYHEQLGKLDKIIEKNHLITFDDSKVNNEIINVICYLQDCRKLIGIYISNSEIIQKWEIQIEKSDQKVLSLMKSKDKLLIGYQNGQIRVYNLNQQVYEQQEYQLQTIEKGHFTKILFNEKFCLGIQKNYIYKLNYEKNKSDILAITKQDIITCAYYFNQQGNEYQIHILQENKKIQVKVQSQQSTQIKRAVKGITCVSLYQQDNKQLFFYGNEEGEIYCCKI